MKDFLLCLVYVCVWPVRFALWPLVALWFMVGGILDWTGKTKVEFILTDERNSDG